jgi:hypothetical protein
MSVRAVGRGGYNYRCGCDVLVLKFERRLKHVIIGIEFPWLRAEKVFAGSSASRWSAGRIALNLVSRATSRVWSAVASVGRPRSRSRTSGAEMLDRVGREHSINPVTETLW